MIELILYVFILGFIIIALEHIMRINKTSLESVLTRNIITTSKMEQYLILSRSLKGPKSVSNNNFQVKIRLISLNN